MMIFRTPEPPPSQPGGNTAADPHAAPTAQEPTPAPDWAFLHEIESLVAGHHHNPHALLGAHQTDNGVIIRALRPLATSVTVILPDGSKYPMPHLHQGVFEATLPKSVAAIPDYRLEVTYDAPNDKAVT